MIILTIAYLFRRFNVLPLIYSKVLVTQLPAFTLAAFAACAYQIS